MENRLIGRICVRESEKSDVEEMYDESEEENGEDMCEEENGRNMCERG